MIPSKNIMSCACYCCVDLYNMYRNSKVASFKFISQCSSPSSLHTQGPQCPLSLLTWVEASVGRVVHPDKAQIHTDTYVYQVWAKGQYIAPSSVTPSLLSDVFLLFWEFVYPSSVQFGMTPLTSKLIVRHHSRSLFALILLKENVIVWPGISQRWCNLMNLPKMAVWKQKQAMECFDRTTTDVRMTVSGCVVGLDYAG